MHMILIGEGSLLAKSLDYCAKSGRTVATVISPPNERIERLSQTLGFNYRRGVDPNEYLVKNKKVIRSELILSINNRRILTDEALDVAPVYNFHNGLVQECRGIAEVCVLAAICRGLNHYGTTVHRLSPGEEIDAGKVVAQRSFEVRSDSSFEQLMTDSLTNYLQTVFAFIDSVCAEVPEGNYVHGTQIYGFQDVERLLTEADEANRLRALRMGNYWRLLHSLRLQVERYLAQNSQ